MHNYSSSRQRKRKIFFSADDIQNIQSDLDLSHNHVKRLAQHVRTAVNSRKYIEAHLTPKLTVRNHRLDDFISVKTMQFMEKEKKTEKFIKIERNVVYANDIIKLIDHTRATRNYVPENRLEIKIGVDGGGGFLKICVNMFNPDEIIEKKTCLRTTLIC